MLIRSLFPGRSLQGIDLVPDQLYRVRCSYPQIVERDVIEQVTSLTTRRWIDYIDDDGNHHNLWIDYISIDSTFNFIDIYFYVDGSPAAVIVVGLIVVAGLFTLALVIKQVAVVVRGYPDHPASAIELPLIIVGGMVVIGVLLYYAAKSGALSKTMTAIAGKVGP
jgi:hypothetical protein